MMKEKIIPLANRMPVSQTILLFGATGMAGGAVLKACLASPDVSEVRAITRRALAVTHPKLKVIVHDNFADYGKIKEAFAGVDACLFCLGISSTQVNEAEYRRISHDYPLAAAAMLAKQSPNAALHYISGRGTKEKSRVMWSQVKGATERELMEKFGGVNWRPAIIDAEPSDSVPAIYRKLQPITRLFSGSRSWYVKGDDLGKAMIAASAQKIRKRIIENPEIRDLAARAT